MATETFFFHQHKLRFQSYALSEQLFYFLNACCPTDKELAGSRAQTPKAKQNKVPVVSEGSFSDDSQVSGKRKRKQPGQWWLSCSQSTEEAKVTDNLPTLKKSKGTNKEVTAEVPSPVKPKKDGVSKRRNQKQHAPSSYEYTNTAEERNPKRKEKNRMTKDKKQTTDEEFKATEVVLVESQDLQPDLQEQDIFAHRDLNLSAGKVPVA